jgi:hypothetical protein
MATVDTILRWLAGLALAIGLMSFAFIVYLSSGDKLQQIFSSKNLGAALLFGSAWIVPALALRSWSSTATGRQSILFYVLSLLSLGLISVVGLSFWAFENAF